MMILVAFVAAVFCELHGGFALSMRISKKNGNCENLVEGHSKMMRWFDQHDIISSKLSIRKNNEGVRGVFLDADAFPNEGICLIPPKMILRSPYKNLGEMLQVRCFLF